MRKSKILKGFAGAALVVAAGTPAAAQYANPAFQIALRAGSIVGAAFICEIAPERTAATGRAVLERLIAIAGAPADIRQAQEMYGAAVQRSAAAQRAPGAPPCPTVVANFDALEVEFVPEVAPRPEMQFGFQPEGGPPQGGARPAP
jgi:hypothetical protein